MSVNSELQNLLTKMGGTPLESDSNSDLLGKMVTVLGGEVDPSDASSDLVGKISDLYTGGGSSGGVELGEVTLNISKEGYNITVANALDDSSGSIVIAPITTKNRPIIVKVPVLNGIPYYLCLDISNGRFTNITGQTGTGYFNGANGSGASAMARTFAVLPGDVVSVSVTDD